MNTRYAYRTVTRDNAIHDLDIVLCREHEEAYLRAFLMLGVWADRQSVPDECVPCALRAHDELPSERARHVAFKAHLGQVDKGGEAYIGHPARVAEAVRKAGYDHDVQAAAWLHDVVEDTTVTLDDLRRQGFSERIVAAVDALTQRKKEKAQDYYARVLQNDVAHVVKWFDIADNSSPARMARLAPETQERLAAKYVVARERLDGPGPLALGIETGRA